MAGRRSPVRAPSAAAVAAELAASAELALADLERRCAAAMTPTRRAAAFRIRLALSRLCATAVELDRGELLVLGSMGQRRPNPLLKVEADLRREITAALQDLCYRVEQAATLERVNAVTREPDTGAGS